MTFLYQDGVGSTQLLDIFLTVYAKKIKGIIQFLQFDVLKKQWNLG